MEGLANVGHSLDEPPSYGYRRKATSMDKLDLWRPYVN
jgi:hypothetical protein